jgi:hypothetical protein
MKLRVEELLVSCHRYQELIPFASFTYFYGKMGAGKSSIARLVDFCFGGGLDLTPALQSEFVGAALTLRVGETPLTLQRDRGANQVRAHWTRGGEVFDTLIPARTSGGEVLPGSGIEVLSDLLFHLVGVTPPKVRRSRIREDSDLERLSVRDLLWYCYLDQDTLDSEFFHLDSQADTFKRNKSRDVLRFVIGFHQERVAALEAQIERLRTERVRLEAGADALRRALADANFASQVDIEVRLREIDAERAATDREIAMVRADVERLGAHGTDELRKQGRHLGAEVAAMEEAVSAVQEVLADDRRHLNELLTLSTKFRRMTSARAVLNGVEFTACPRCARPLPIREEQQCQVCGQLDAAEDATEEEAEATDRDIQARSTELREAIAQREAKLAGLRRRIADLGRRKASVDAELTAASLQYDSAYLSRALTLEHSKARLEGEAVQLERLRVLPQAVEDQLQKAQEIGAQESILRRELRDAQEAAERDTANLRALEQLFLDCLVRSRIPGFSTDDVVRIQAPWFLPEVSDAREAGVISTSFANLGSGGKKTLFKCCFALAIHRLAARIGALLPTLLVIDSPMKNISERENREQFEGFHELLYELAAGELRDTQFIVIDKELFPPPPTMGIEVAVRHMTPDDPKDGPLLHGYRGH